MSNVSIRDLRNHGGDIVERATTGEHIVITRNGKPVAELRPLASRGVPMATVLASFAGLPTIDVVRFRADVDAFIDQSL